jgi:predicted signal transduction protein with EAL and GGDEF domain
MARSLGYRATADGVETSEQLALLSAEGCDELQGFYFSHPLNAGELDAWLSNPCAARRPPRDCASMRRVATEEAGRDNHQQRQTAADQHQAQYF